MRLTDTECFAADCHSPSPRLARLWRDALRSSARSFTPLKNGVQEFCRAVKRPDSGRRLLASGGLTLSDVEEPE